MTSVKIKQGGRVARITETRINQAGKLLYKVTWEGRVTMAVWATADELYNNNPVEVVNDAIAGYLKRPAWEGQMLTYIQGLVADLLQAPSVIEPELIEVVTAYKPAFVANPYSIVVYQGAAA